jgi:hypothetical protein
MAGLQGECQLKATLRFSWLAGIRRMPPVSVERSDAKSGESAVLGPSLLVHLQIRECTISGHGCPRMTYLSYTALTAMLLIALVGCSQAPNDPCSLIPDANAAIGQPVTAQLSSSPGRSTACTWKSAEGRLCGSISVLGPGWTQVAAGSDNYKQLTASMSAMGSVSSVAGVGDEAQAIDAGSKGALLVFRKGPRSVVMVSACNGHSLSNNEFVVKLGREVAAQL